MPTAPELPWLVTAADGSLLLRLHIQPRASANGVAGLQGEALKLRLTSPPVDGQANKAVIAFLAKLLHLPKSALSIKSGQQSRSKTVAIKGADGERVRAVLTALVAGGGGG